MMLMFATTGSCGDTLSASRDRTRSSVQYPCRTRTILKYVVYPESIPTLLVMKCGCVRVPCRAKVHFGTKASE